ncbi:hypothetical protein FQ041_17805 [Escherichia coli]|nr:hypothetical protein [Escherichia coli]
MSSSGNQTRKKQRYITGAMCFMLFVWLGGVVALCAFAAVECLKKGSNRDDILSLKCFPD